MELKDTIDGMLSNDYKERFKAEYKQVFIRYKKLEDIINNYYDLDFKPKTPLSLLKKQSRVMFDYLNVLSERAIYEGINLD